ncbi:MAG: polyphosphate kinase 2 [Polyangiales bacterium]|jgi:polyphosphate kinase 2
MLSRSELEGLKTRKDLLHVAKAAGVPTQKHVFRVQYEEQIRHLQAQLVDLQQHVIEKKLRVAIIFEGRDAAGKGGAIRRFMEHLNPRAARVVALAKPTDVERGQWYFRRYIKELPNPGEIVFFDRSWYNRAVVEPVMGFCDDAQYRQFMVQVPEFEHMLHQDGVHLTKFWFSIAQKEQKKRFAARLESPLKRWKYSAVDERGQELWEDYTKYKEQMFSLTHTSFSPWIIVRGNNKKKARLESVRYVLSRFDYPGKEHAQTTVLPDPNIIGRYHRQVRQIDV